jgi:glycosyltransferase involved in cell wall biosynthesis
MRIAIVNQPFDGILPPGQNSIGIWSYEVARPLAARHQVRVFGRHMRDAKRAGVPRLVERDGVTYRLVFAAPLRVWGWVSALWERLLDPSRPIYASVLYYLEYTLLVALRVRAFRPDVVHIHNMTGFVPVIRLLNRRSAVVLHMNCEWLSQLDELRMARRIAQVDAVFGSSDHITGLVQRRFPQYADRCHTVYNGVDPEAFQVSTDDDDGDGDNGAIVFVGRVSPEKGVHDLLEAMPEVARRVPGVRLDVVGPVGALARSFIVDVSDDPLVAGLARLYDRDYGDTLRELADRCPDGSVRFLGSQSHADVVRLVGDADVLVNPSYSESFGMSLVEALACGTPVVATRVGGMPEIVRDDAGILVERSDPAGLVDALVRMLDDVDLRRRCGEAGRRRVESTFAWTSIAARAETLYAGLVRGS